MATIVGPETSNTPYFTLITTLDPDDLAKASTLLLSAVEARPKLTQAFRLEVKFLQENAQFQICLDPVLWYDVYLRVNPRLDEAVRIAREYVTSIRTQILPEEDGPFVVEYDEIEKDKAFIPCNKIYLIINPNVVSVLFLFRPKGKMSIGYGFVVLGFIPLTLYPIIFIHPMVSLQNLTIQSLYARGT